MPFTHVFGSGTPVVARFTFSSAGLARAPTPKRFPVTTVAESIVAAASAYKDVQPLIEAAFPPKPFRFLDLPPELRLDIYSYALAPTGSISLAFGEVTFGYRAPRKRDTGLATSVLRVSRQVQAEAEPVLYDKNNIIVDLDNICSRSTAPAIHIFRNFVAASAYPKLKHITLTLAFGEPTTTTTNSVTSFSSVDWRQLQQMTGLKTLGIMAFRNTDMTVDVAWAKELLTEILERVPKSCGVAFGVVTAEQQVHLSSYMAMPFWLYTKDKVTVVIIEKEMLEQAMEELECERGSKCESQVDYRWKKCGVFAL